MVIMGMVVLATVTLTVGMQRTDAGTWGRTDDTTSAQYAMRVISKAVPYALQPAVFADAITEPLLEATDTRLAVVIRDPDSTATSGASTTVTSPEDLLLVEVEIVGGVLTERRTALGDLSDGDELLAALPLSSTCALRSCTTRVLVDGLETGSGFRYLDQDGVEVSADIARAVEVTLVVLTSPGRQDVASTHRQRIYLKND